LAILNFGFASQLFVRLKVPQEDLPQMRWKNAYEEAHTLKIDTDII
jgi:hypothetical protein